MVADLATPEGRRRAVTEAAERCGGSLAGIVTCAGLAGAPDRPGSLVAAVNYFGTVEVLEGLRPLLVQGGAAVAISSNSTTVQPAIPADLVEACLDGDAARSAQIADAGGRSWRIRRASWHWRTGCAATRPAQRGRARDSGSTPLLPA